MRKKLLTAVLCMGSLAMQAQSQLVVKTTDGSTEKFALAEDPKVGFSVTYGETWVTVGDKVKKLDIKSLQLEDLPTETGVMVVINVDGGKVMIPAAELKTIIAKTFDEGAEHLPKVIASDPSVSIYNAALEVTHMKDSLMRYMDASYGFASEQDRLDSCYWNKDKLVVPGFATSEFDNIAYPAKRYYKYTALLVPDDVLKEKYSIASLDDLRAKAHELYDPMYPEDANVTDEIDRRNALNRFISYHLLPFFGDYFKLTAFDKGRLQHNFNREKADITDWYETMMPHSLIKFSFPAGTDEGILQEGLYVNRRGVKTGADDRGVFVRGARVTQVPYKMYEDGSGIKPYIAENGTYHYIDEIVAYDQQMQQVVCNDRMRIDCTTLSPDFMTSGARGHSTRVVTEADGDKYGQYSSSTQASTNPNTCLAFKRGFMENIETPKTWIETEDGGYWYSGNTTQIHVRNRYLNSWSYQGDAVLVSGGEFDVKMKLPSLPAGKYELRLGTYVGQNEFGHLNLYIDDQLVGERIDLRTSGDTPISPYNYMSEKTYLNGAWVTRYYLDQEVVWVDEATLENIEKVRLVEGPDGWVIRDSWRESIKEEYELESEEDVETLFKEQIIDALFKKKDQSLYNEAKRYWERAQRNPTQYVFEGKEPIDPRSEEMDDYYNNLIDWTAFFKLGPVKYFDQVLHDKGWMRAPASFCGGEHDAFDNNAATVRNYSRVRRRVVGTFETDGKSDHFLHLQQQDFSPWMQLQLDYIELVPVSLIENENIY